MATILRLKVGYRNALRSSQLRYAVIYVVITALALCFLNYYSASTSRELLFRADETALMERTRLVASSCAGGGIVTEESAQHALTLLDSSSYDRIVITDAAGVVLYDTRSTGNETGCVFLVNPVVQALQGNDSFYARFRDSTVECCAAVPIVSYEVPIGAVYLLQCNADQGQLLKVLEANVLRLSVVLEILVIAFSSLFSFLYARRMRQVLRSIRMVREGDYSYKINIHSRDEMELLATEFNALTDRLKVSEQKRRQFVSDASHELKTPLASIKLLSDSILQNEMDMDTLREFVGDIGNEADRLTRMSRKLLELTRLDAMVEEERQSVEIQPVAQKVFRMLGPQMAARQLQLEDATLPDCRIRIAPDDLYQILFNLVENGIKYNNDRGLLRLSTENDENHVTLRVEDSGVGIPPDAMGQIFERFYRVDKARSRQAGGSGLGLSIVHDMVVRNYGTIRAENRPGGGTCFTLVFPSDMQEVHQ